MPGAKRIAVNAFLAFHLLAIVCWCVPVHVGVIDAGRRLIRPYMVWSGLFQTWDMFAPGPKTLNGYLEAIVLYGDGTTRVWPFPRMERLSLRERYFEERYRKFAEVLTDDSKAAFWPDVARFIARRNNNARTPVRMVMLVRYWSPILPDAGNTAPVWDEHVFYSYAVQPGDLE